MVARDEGESFVARRRERGIKRRRRRRLVALFLACLLAPVVYSWASTMSEPSSLPLSVRTIEWLRANHGTWLVNTVESYWYTWTTPDPGGPTLKALPRIGTPVARIVSHPARARARPYGPPRIRPVIAPALAGEGVWHAAGQPTKGLPGLLVSTYRSEPDYPRVVAYVAWIDHTKTELALYPGRYEPPGASPRGPMSVPRSRRRDLLATFNSGFAYRDGHGGFSVDGRVATPLRAGDGTVVEYRNGRVDVVAWHGGAGPGADIVLARQNLPLIVDHGRPNPRLADDSLWGNTLGNAVRVWRTGIGIDGRGNLIYAAADLQTARTLAAILVHVGAVRAIELDINPEWPTFNVYGRWGARDPVKLVPNDQQSATRYLVADDRDFFAVYRRLPGPVTVPFR